MTILQTFISVDRRPRVATKKKPRNAPPTWSKAEEPIVYEKRNTSFRLLEE
jgi:hypothetical protein